MKRRRYFLFATGLVMAGAAIWLFVSQREPAYLGKPITYWVEPWQHHNTESKARVEAAFASMDERAVEWLVHQLAWKPSSFRASMNKALRRFDQRIDLVGRATY